MRFGKMLLLFGMLLGATVAFAADEADYGTYCAKFLNGELGERPGMLTDFSFKAGKIRVNGAEVQSLVVDGPSSELTSGARTTKFNRKKNVEVEEVAVFMKNRRGKSVKQYTLEITRDATGRVLEIKKQYPVLKVFNGNVLPEVITLKYGNKNKCYPSEYRKALKRQFSTEYCRELQAYFEENPKALECMKSGYDQAVSEIIAKYDMDYRLIGPKKRFPSIYSGKALGQCDTYGVLDASNMDDQSRVVSDDALWEGTPIVVPTGDDQGTGTEE